MEDNLRLMKKWIPLTERSNERLLKKIEETLPHYFSFPEGHRVPDLKFEKSSFMREKISLKRDNPERYCFICQRAYPLSSLD